jgi:hypothetical protein
MPPALKAKTLELWTEMKLLVDRNEAFLSYG